MTATQMIPAVGAQVEVRTGVGEIAVLCEVRDVKTSYGNIRLFVTPVAGSGSAWVELSRVRTLGNQRRVVAA